MPVRAPAGTLAATAALLLVGLALVDAVDVALADVLCEAEPAAEEDAAWLAVLVSDLVTEEPAVSDFVAEVATLELAAELAALLDKI